MDNTKLKPVSSLLNAKGNRAVVRYAIGVTAPVGRGYVPGALVLHAVARHEMQLFWYKGRKIRLYYQFQRPYFRRWVDKGALTPYSHFMEYELSKMDSSLVENNTVKYLNRLERLGYRVSFEEGKIWQRGKRLPQAAYMYVIDSKDICYMAEKVTGKFHHSSLVGGEAVKEAGMVYLTYRGKVLAPMCWLIASGHYRAPESHLSTAKKYFRCKGVAEF